MNSPALRRNLPVMRKQFYQLAIIAFAAALFICLYLLARFNDRGKLADS